MEVGTGKTLTMVNILRLVAMNEGRLPRTLILSPIITLKNWRNEIILNSHIDAKQIKVLEGSGKDKAEEILGAGESVCIGNYEMLLSKDIMKAIHKWKPEVLICDESHKLKNPSSSRTKLVLEIAEDCQYKFIMTGTPVLRNLMDLWAQLKILDGGQRLGKSFFGFRNRYFVNMNAGNPFKNWPEYVTANGAAEEIGRLVADISFQAKKAECLTLPPLIKVPVPVALTREQRNHYNMIKNELLTIISEEQSVTAPLAIVKIGKLQQIVSGFVTTDSGEEIQFKATPREKALEDLLEECVIEQGQKVIVWAVFKNNYETIRRVCEKLKIKYVEVHGDISNKKKFENVDLFNGDNSVGVLIGHPGSGGVGVNLTSSSVAVYYSRNFSLELDVQSEGRNYRGGSEVHEKITHFDISAEDTIDQDIANASREKKQIGADFLKAALTRTKGKAT